MVRRGSATESLGSEALVGGAHRGARELYGAGLEWTGGPVVELSKRYHVMSRYTSLLVLENDQMFAEFGVQRSAPPAALDAEPMSESARAEGPAPAGLTGAMPAPAPSSAKRAASPQDDEAPRESAKASAAPARRMEADERTEMPAAAPRSAPAPEITMEASLGLTGVRRRRAPVRCRAWVDRHRRLCGSPPRAVAPLGQPVLPQDGPREATVLLATPRVSGALAVDVVEFAVGQRLGFLTYLRLPHAGSAKSRSLRGGSLSSW